MLEQHVQVAHLAQRAAGPRQLRPHLRRPSRRRASAAPPAAVPAAGGWPRGAGAAPRGRCPAGCRGRARRIARYWRSSIQVRCSNGWRLPPGRRAFVSHQPQRPKQLRPLVGVESAGRPQRPLDPLQRASSPSTSSTSSSSMRADRGPLPPVTTTSSTTTSARSRPSVAHDYPLAQGIERGDRAQRAAARGRRQQVAEPRRHRLRRARQLQLERGRRRCGSFSCQAPVPCSAR